MGSRSQLSVTPPINHVRFELSMADAAHALAIRRDVSSVAGDGLLGMAETGREPQRKGEARSKERTWEVMVVPLSPTWPPMKRRVLLVGR